MGAEQKILQDRRTLNNQKKGTNNWMRKGRYVDTHTHKIVLKITKQVPLIIGYRYFECIITRWGGEIKQYRQLIQIWAGENMKSRERERPTHRGMKEVRW